MKLINSLTNNISSLLKFWKFSHIPVIQFSNLFVIILDRLRHASRRLSLLINLKCFCLVYELNAHCSNMYLNSDCNCKLQRNNSFCLTGKQVSFQLERNANIKEEFIPCSIEIAMLLGEAKLLKMLIVSVLRRNFIVGLLCVEFQLWDRHA